MTKPQLRNFCNIRLIDARFCNARRQTRKVSWTLLPLLLIFFMEAWKCVRVSVADNHWLYVCLFVRGLALW